MVLMKRNFIDDYNKEQYLILTFVKMINLEESKKYKNERLNEFKRIKVLPFHFT